MVGVIKDWMSAIVFNLKWLIARQTV